MSNVHYHFDNFNAGELTPLIAQRFNVEKVMAGCKTARNTITGVHGGFARRPGLIDIDPTIMPTETRLKEFSFSTDTNLVLEFGNMSFGVISDRVRLFLTSSVQTPYLTDELQELQFLQVNDVVWITHPNHEVMKLTRLSNTEWTLVESPWGYPPLLDENVTSKTMTYGVTGVDPGLQVKDYTISTALAVSYDPATLETYGALFKSFTYEAMSVDWTFGLTITGGTSGATGVARRWENRLSFDTETAAFTVGQTLTGGTSGATANIVALDSDGSSGFLVVDTLAVAGFQVGEAITDGAGGAAVTTSTVHGSVTVSADTGTFEVGEALTDSGLPAGAANCTSPQGDNGIKYFPGTQGTATAPPPAGDAVIDNMNIPNPREGSIITGYLNVQEAGTWSFSMNADEGARAYVNGTSVVYDIGPAYGGPWTGTIDLDVGTHELLIKLYNHTTGGDVRFSIKSPTGPDENLSAVSGTNWDIYSTQGSTGGLTSSTDHFMESHVGAYFEVAHVREQTPIKMTITGGTALQSDPVRVEGFWDFSTQGTFQGWVYLERSIDEKATWEQVYSFESPPTRNRNVVTDGTEEGSAWYRIAIPAGNSGSGAEAIFEPTGQVHRGLVKVTEYNSPTSVQAEEIIATLNTSATSKWTEGAFSDYQGHPRTISLHQGRLYYGGTLRRSNGIWASVSNDFENFRRSSYDDGSIHVQPAAESSNPIQWMASQRDTLIFGTTGEEWTLAGGGSAITPTNIEVERQSSFGSEFMPAVLAHGSVLFVQRGGKRIRRIGARSADDPWSATDVTILAEHLFKDVKIKQMAFQLNPSAILWVTTDNGELFGMTFETEQNVFGWHRHDTYTGGTDTGFESVIVLPATTSDEVYFTVNRDGIDGRNVEVFDTEVFDAKWDEWYKMVFVDGAQIYRDGSNVSTISLGTSRYDGETVYYSGYKSDALPDNNTFLTDPGPTGGGYFSTSILVNNYQIGWPYTSTITPTRREIPLESGSSVGRVFDPSRMGVQLIAGWDANLSGHGAATTAIRDANGDELYDTITSAAGIHSGYFEIVSLGDVSDGMDITIQTDLPLPMTVGSLIWKGDVTDD